jgi:hypothetical protein
MKSNFIDLMTKIHPNPIRIFGEKWKSSPIGKFAVNPEIALQMLTV